MVIKNRQKSQFGYLNFNNGIYTTVNNYGHQTILDTPNLRYICIDSSEQVMIQTILDQSGISANIEIECEDFTTRFTENPLGGIKIYPNQQLVNSIFN
ncbi:MAG: hypothetical protein IPN86_16145 [Saprospiraceae bacterium]|nr:hypothetical protein [Saprospiraceae bacterium]